MWVRGFFLVRERSFVYFSTSSLKEEWYYGTRLLVFILFLPVSLFMMHEVQLQSQLIILNNQWLLCEEVNTRKINVLQDLLSVTRIWCSTHIQVFGKPPVAVFPPHWHRQAECVCWSSYSGSTRLSSLGDAWFQQRGGLPQEATLCELIRLLLSLSWPAILQYQLPLAHFWSVRRSGELFVFFHTKKTSGI